MSRPATKKKLIEDAAIKLFATRGLPGTVIKEIAREADVTEGALYKHYRSKNEMAWQLFCRELKIFSEIHVTRVIQFGLQIIKTCFTNSIWFPTGHESDINMHD